MQTEPTSPPVSSAPLPAPRAAPTATVAYVPPPPGLARGKYEVPGWVVGAAIAMLLIAVIAFFVIRHRRAKKSDVYESVAPQSGPMSRR